ncbi:MAG: hypothetical protein H0W19_09045 [Nitrosopumilus sp.]|nr:hypothetical protein [Nitrosopumilus sp.]
MNKFTKEIVNILDAQIENKPYDFQESGLTLEQIEQITKFARGYSRAGVFPFPLKSR